MLKMIISTILTIIIGLTPVYASGSADNYAPDQSSLVPKGVLTTAKSAVETRNSLRVAFIGDSITKSSYLLDSNDSYVERVMGSIIDNLPNVNVSYQNFALNGSTTSSFLDPNNKQGSGFNEPWGFVGKSWRDTVRDYAPDLLVVALGINDGSGNSSVSDETVAKNLGLIIDDARAWTSHPSVVLVPTILPTTDPAKYQARQDVEMSVARATKAVAQEKQVAVADANHLYTILRDGKDSLTPITYTYSNWDNYSENWVGDTSIFTVSNNSLTTADTTRKSISTVKKFFNGTIDVDITPSVEGDPGVTWVNYRDSDIGKMTVLVGAGNGTGYLRLYSWDPTSNYTMLIQVSNLIIPINQITHLRIESKNNRHIVRLNGNKLIDLKTYAALNDGSVTIRAGQNASVLSGLVINFRDPLISTPKYTELELLGNFDGKNINGNGINHPTPLGHAMVYYPAFYGVLNELTR